MPLPPVPSRIICPRIVTSPDASMVTGVFVALRRNVIVTFAGIFIVVKLNVPPGGT
jgi:hypothetical protein